MKGLSHRLFHLEGATFRVSVHAMERMLDMQVAPETVRAALTNPSQIVEDKRRPTRRTYCRGQIGIVLDKDRHNDALVLVTCLWRDDKHWKKDIERGGYTDRKIRLPDYTEETFFKLLNGEIPPTNHWSQK